MSAPAAAILAAIVATLITAGIYAIECWLRPVVPCSPCNGSGLGPSLKRACRWCHGHRMRLRAGRRVFNHAHSLYQASGDRRAAARGRS